MIKGYSHPLGESGVAFMAAPALAARLTGGFPDCLDGAPLLLPGRDSALHRTLPCWLERQGKRVRIVGEFDDSALMKVFGEAGAGMFVTPIASVPDVTAHYKLVKLGETEEIREQSFLISAERRFTHPAAQAVSENAHSGMFTSPLPAR